MGGGGKGGSQTTEVKIPPSLELYAKDVMNMSMTAAQQPFQANEGMKVAAMNPMQVAAMKGASGASAAYGQPYVADGAIDRKLPEIDRTEGGIAGHSTKGLYKDAINRTYDQQYRAQRNLMYTDPSTGQKANPLKSNMYERRYGGSNPNKPLALGPDERKDGGGK